MKLFQRRSDLSRPCPKPIPVRLSFPQQESRADAWGRLRDLSPRFAEIETLVRVSVGESVKASWDLEGASFSMDARVLSAREESDGYFAARLFFTEKTQRQGLGRTLFDLFSRTT